MVSPSVMGSTVKQQQLLFSPGSLFHIIYTHLLFMGCFLHVARFLLHLKLVLLSSQFLQ